MSDYLETGFFVREPAWHNLGEVLDEYPGREKAMELAGHGFNVIEVPVYLGEFEVPEYGPNEGARIARLGENPSSVEGWKALVKDTDGTLLNVAKDSYQVVQNDVAWDIVDALVGAGAKYETGITLKDGRVCSVLAWLDEPVQVPGDDSETLPFVNVSWAHDGSAAITSRATSVRVVCWNTLSAAEAQGQRLGTDFTFRHSKNVMEKIEDAKLALQGVRDSHAEYMELARELAEVAITEEQRELFVTSFIPTPPEALISDRVKENIEEARGQVRGLFDGPTIPESHELTAYGLQLAGVEYLDHLRGYRNDETRYGRSLLRAEPAKAKLTRLIKEVAKA